MVRAALINAVSSSCKQYMSILYSAFVAFVETFFRNKNSTEKLKRVIGISF